MGMSVLTKSEATGAMVTTGLLILSVFLQGSRVTPFWNPANFSDDAAADVLAWTVQNRIGYGLLTAAVAVLAFGRAERREKLLGS